MVSGGSFTFVGVLETIETFENDEHGGTYLFHYRYSFVLYYFSMTNIFIDLLIFSLSCKFHDHKESGRMKDVDDH